MKRKIIAALLSMSMLTAGAVMPVQAQENTLPQTDYNSEIMNRGLVAMKTDGGIYLSWRLNPEEDSIFGSSDENVEFDVYRDGAVIARVSDTTNYVDKNGSLNSVYAVQPVENDGFKGNISENVKPFSSGSNYFDIPIDLPDPYTITYTDADGNEQSIGPKSFTPTDCSTGDLDGDGEYEIVVKLVCNELDVGNGGYSGITKLAAYKLDGTKMWENDIDFGRNVYSSAHTVQFLVYDFDGDGKAEITAQTAPGSKDAKGNYVSKVSTVEAIKNLTDTENETADYRTVGDGRVASGPEYLTVFSGETGEAIDTINYPTERYSITCWGKSDGGNRSLRFLADVAYLDGEKPYAVYWRGYYNHGSGRTGIAGISFDGKRLSVDYIFDTLSGQPGYTAGNEVYAGEGNHNITVADVDKDGKDEIIAGALCMEVNDSGKLMPKWCTFRGHGDALHIGDYDPTHEGYEFFTVHEEGNATSEGIDLDFGMSVIDAATGEIMYHEGGNKDTGRGIMANVGAGGYYQFVSAQNSSTIALGNGKFEKFSIQNMSMNSRIFWDGDLYDELLDGTSITSWNGSYMQRIFNADNCTKVNGSKSTPSLSADILGDWREEVIYPLSDNTALRVFTTNIFTEYKMKTLMSDRVYRSGVAAEQTAYNQPPHLGYYMDIESFKGEAVKISVKNMPLKTKYFVGEEFDRTGLSVTAEYADGKKADITTYTIEGFDSNKAAVQEITIIYENVTDKINIEVVTGFSVDENGMINGYTDVGETAAIVPESIDGITVTGFAKDSLTGAEIERVYAYDADLKFENGKIFSDKTTLYGYSNTSAETYAKKYKVSWVALDAPIKQYLTFDEDFYTEYAGGSMLLQTTTASELKDNIVTYRTAALDSRAPFPTDTYGFEIVKENNANQYLKVCSGIYDSRFMKNNQVYMQTNDSYSTDTTAKAVLTMNIYFPTDTNAPFIELQDDTGVVDTLSKEALGIENDKWYTYSLAYENGVYTRTVATFEGAVISETKLDASAGKNLVNTIAFKQAFVWGNESSETKTGIVYLDNVSLNVTSASKVKITVTNEEESPIKGAVVYLNGNEYKTDSAGKVTINVEKGSYGLSVNANGYYGESLKADMYDDIEIGVRLKAKENAVNVIKENVYAKADISDTDYSDFVMLQDKENKSKTIGDISYCLGSRAGGGDGFSGFVKSGTGNDSYLNVRAGKFNTSNRHAYITFDKAPKLADNDSCTFKTDIYYVGGNTYDMSVKISDGSSTITTTSVTVSDALKQNTWYVYTLAYSNGEFTETYSDMSGNTVYTNTLTANAVSISRIDFTAPGARAEVYLKNMVLSVPYEFEQSQVYTIDESNQITFLKGDNSLIVTADTQDEVKDWLLINAMYDESGVLVKVLISKFQRKNGTYTAEMDYQNGVVNKTMVWKDYSPLIKVQ